jgi:hypothetical protein
MGPLTRLAGRCDIPRQPLGWLVAVTPTRVTEATGGGRVAPSRSAGGWDDHPEESIVLAKPSPTELTAPINPDRGVEGHRNLFCNFYDACLDEAVKKGWNSWTCTRCALHAVEPEVEGGLESYATQRRLT